MDKIWHRNPSKSEVIGCCGGDEKPEWPRRTEMSNARKKKKKKSVIDSCLDILLADGQGCLEGDLNIGQGH